MSDDLPSEIEMLSQPLLTEDGALNPACMNELGAAISGMEKTFTRCADDPEWAEPQWTLRDEIVGYFAMWACRQSPYGVPDGLEDVCKYLYASLGSVAEWIGGDCEMTKCSLCDVNRWLHEILYEQGVKQFDAWNVAKVGHTPDIQFTCAGDSIHPDRNFIDLDVLFHNVSLGIRDERRKNKAFDDKFEAEHGKL